MPNASQAQQRATSALPPTTSSPVGTLRDSDVVATPAFAERHGPTVLLLVGVVLILASVASAFLGHQLLAGGMSTTGFLAIVVGAVLGRMEGPFKLFGLSGSLRRPVNRPVPDDASSTSAPTQS